MRPDLEDLRRAFQDTARTGELGPMNLSDDFVWDMSTFSGWPEGQEFRGLEGAREFFARWVGAFDDWGFDVEEFLETPEGAIVVLRQWGVVPGGSVRTEMHFAHRWTWDGEHWSRVRLYDDPDTARHEAGV